MSTFFVLLFERFQSKNKQSSGSSTQARKLIRIEIWERRKQDSQDLASWVKLPCAPRQKPRAATGAQPTLPAPPAGRTCRGRAASAPCRPPHAPRPAPTPTPAPRPRRPRPALAQSSPRARPAPRPRSLRAGAGARGRESRRGRHGAESTGASPGPPLRPGRSLTYLRRISPPPWGSTWPGRARPRGRGGQATARRGRPRARLWRTASRSGGGQAARGSGRRIPHRPSGMPPPPPPRPDREAPRAAQQSRAARPRAPHLSVAAAPAPLLGPSQLPCSAPGAAAVRLASAGSQDGRACATPRRAGARAARARAARARARAHAPLPRASGGKSARSDWTAPRRSYLAPPRTPALGGSKR